MKLFTRYSRLTLFANLAIFLVASFAFYFSIRYVLIRVIDEDLEIEENEIQAFVREHNKLPESFSVSDQVIFFTPDSLQNGRDFSTFERLEKNDHKEVYRRLRFSITAGGKPYLATVAKSLEGTENLQRSILAVSISTVLLILLVSAILNRVVLKKLWQPFYASLTAVRSFRVSKDLPLVLPSTNTDEFKTMNETLEGLTQKSRLEYLALKTFSENASHEIQTPLAVIRSKLDLLIQDEKFSEAQSKTLQTAYNAVEKLNRLNRSLLLLAKIENNQFAEQTTIDLKEKLEEKLQDFSELWLAKGIKTEANLERVFVCMNPQLVDLLLNNLLSNAISHNVQRGCISVQLNAAHLRVCNSSSVPELDAGKLFVRFYKSSSESTSNGLGLSIVKQIADASSLVLGYTFHSGVHCFTVSWKASETKME